MKKSFRLTRSKDIKRVRLLGRSHAHPLLVLLVAPNDLPVNRFGVIAGRSIGNAVKRNRAKRRLRAALEPLYRQTAPGFDLIFLARKPLLQAPYPELQTAVKQLLSRAGLVIVDERDPD